MYVKTHGSDKYLTLAWEKYILLENSKSEHILLLITNESLATNSQNTTITTVLLKRKER